MKNDEFEAPATDLSSKGGAEIGRTLRQLASAVRSETAIGGRGAGTTPLALGVARTKPRPAFRDTATEVEKAAANGIARVVGQNTSPLMGEPIAPFATEVSSHRGPLANASSIGVRCSPEIGH